MNLHIPSLNTEFKFKDGRVRNATRITNAKWDEHKELLYSLHKEMSINEILIFTQAAHGFVAKKVLLFLSHLSILCSWSALLFGLLHPKMHDSNTNSSQPRSAGPQA
jgi:hypothetical protein